jgi:hypothetical protein
LGLAVPYADQAQYRDNDLARRSQAIDGQGDVTTDHHKAIGLPTITAVTSASSR